MIGYVAAGAVGVVIGCVIGLTRFIASGHPCREDECYAVVGAEHAKCPSHRRGRP